MCTNLYTNSVHKNVHRATWSLSCPCLECVWIDVFWRWRWFHRHLSPEPGSSEAAVCIVCTSVHKRPTKKEECRVPRCERDVSASGPSSLVCFCTNARHCKLCAAVSSKLLQNRLVLLAQNGEAHKLGWRWLKSIVSIWKFQPSLSFLMLKALADTALLLLHWLLTGSQVATTAPGSPPPCRSVETLRLTRTTY